MTFSLLLPTVTEFSAYYNRMIELQLKFDESEENNQKHSQSSEELSQSAKDHREQIRDLTMETKRLEMKSIQQEKTTKEILKRITFKRNNR